MDSFGIIFTIYKIGYSFGYTSFYTISGVASLNYLFLVQHIAAVVSLVVLSVGIAKRRTPQLMYFTFIALIVCFYSMGYFLAIKAASPEAAMTAFRLRVLGLPFLPPLFYLFTRDYYNQPVRKIGRVCLLLLPSLLITCAINFPFTHYLYSASYTYQSEPIPHLVAEYGLLHLAAVLYGAACMVAGIVVICRALFTPHSVRRINSFTILIAALIPFITGVIDATTLLPPGVLITPAILSFSMGILCLFMLRFRSAEWIPYARESVLEYMNDAFILINTNGRFLDANPKACEYFPELQTLAAGTHIAQVGAFPLALIKGATPVYEFTVGNGKETRYLRASSTPILYNSKPVCVSILVYDITEIHILMQELNELANHDALTGLYNRGTFFKFATRDFELAQRSRQPGAAMMVDIDFFKKVNDKYGHPCGDTVLVEVADILRKRLRNTDICGRYGGEEIAIYLPGANAEAARLIAEVLRSTIERKVFAKGNEVFNITISIGLSVLDFNRHQSFEDMLSDADAALYEAKSTGRNKVCIFRTVSDALGGKSITQGWKIPPRPSR